MNHLSAFYGDKHIARNKPQACLVCGTPGPDHTQQVSNLISRKGRKASICQALIGKLLRSGELEALVPKRDRTYGSNAARSLLGSGYIVEGCNFFGSCFFVQLKRL